ncbi:cytochrome c oxidase subunit II [Caenibacillus caldisaponilyticus]|jgi:cytochrome c oxidase subunit 2|uniref:cytochrome c oxidase subunit II n=1 Tax=Caenibacillus caldisaponilyticus TaxID=1674942 RepID=UPI000988681F|nr:cytochrome c oxidase subunit II [Caenibacillus caldisaponilyticus]
MKRKWQRWFRLLPLAALALLLSGCGKEGVSALEPLGPVAKDQADLMLISVLIMVVVVLVVGFIYFYVLIRFRKRKGQEDYIPKQVEGNTTLEIVWTVIPIVLLCILAVPTVPKTFSLSDTHSAKKESALEIEVSANQFWWQFTYPKQKVTTAQDVVIPTDRPVVFKLTSNDVIHSFWVPALGGKVDANPGQVTTLKLEADKEGTYRGRCAELCGSSHALMYFNVKAVSSAEFDRWIKEMKAGPDQPASASAKQGEQLFKQNCMSCHAVGASQTNKLAPNLTNFADRKYIAGFLDHDKKTLEKWIADPSALKPGATMPARGASGKLTDEQIKQIADYLFTLSVEK